MYHISCDIHGLHRRIFHDVVFSDQKCSVIMHFQMETHEKTECTYLFQRVYYKMYVKI